MGVEPDGESNKSFAGWATRERYMEEHVVYADGVWQFLALTRDQCVVVLDKERHSLIRQDKGMWANIEVAPRSLKRHLIATDKAKELSFRYNNSGCELCTAGKRRWDWPPIADGGQGQRWGNN